MEYKAYYKQGQLVPTSCNNIVANTTEIIIPLGEFSKIDQTKFSYELFKALKDCHKNGHLPKPPVTQKDVNNITGEFLGYPGSRIIWVSRRTGDHTELWLSKQDKEIRFVLLTDIHDETLNNEEYFNYLQRCNNYSLTHEENNGLLTLE